MKPVSSRFSPHSVEPAQLERLLVGRERLLKEVLEDLQTTIAAEGARYEVLVGPRGMGKSHALAILKSRLEAAMPQLPIAMLGEEAQLPSILALLAKLLGVLAGQEAVVRVRRAAPADRVETAIRLIESRVDEGPLVIAFENLDHVLSAMGKHGQKAFRNLLQSHPRWSVLCTSTSWSSALENRDAPLYRMCVRRDLGPLTPHGCWQMLRRLAEAHGEEGLLVELDGPEAVGRVKAIHHVVGGAPRAIAHIFPHLASRSLGDLEAAFFQLSDELTPYFQEQIARRPPGQRALLDALAESWQPLSVSELAELSFATHQTTSGQLRYLVRDGLVGKVQVGRSAFYSVRSPLMRIVRAMKSPSGHASAFVRFATGWAGTAAHRWFDDLGVDVSDAFHAQSRGYQDAMLEITREEETRLTVERLIPLHEAAPTAESASLVALGLALLGEEERLRGFLQPVMEAYGLMILCTMVRISGIDRAVALAWPLLDEAVGTREVTKLRSSQRSALAYLLEKPAAVQSGLRALGTSSALRQWLQTHLWVRDPAKLLSSSLPVGAGFTDGLSRWPAGLVERAKGWSDAAHADVIAAAQLAKRQAPLAMLSEEWTPKSKSAGRLRAWLLGRNGEGEWISPLWMKAGMVTQLRAAATAGHDSGPFATIAPLEAARCLSSAQEAADLKAWLMGNEAENRIAIAICDLATSPLAIGRLAPPERKIVRHALLLHHGSESEWVRRLPDESDFE